LGLVDGCSGVSESLQVTPEQFTIHLWSESLARKNPTDGTGGKIESPCIFFTYAIVIAYAKGSAPINRQFVTKHEWYMK
jgi:hypothetical protein